MISEGSLNVDLEKAGSWGWDEEIVAAVATTSLEDLVGHFPLQRQAWSKDWMTWVVARQGRVVRS